MILLCTTLTLIGIEVRDTEGTRGDECHVILSYMPFKVKAYKLDAC
jgi:hypothetical protein